MTVLTGVVDAVSYLKLGHVFVANMTGNVVFLGFAAAGARGIDPLSSIVAIVAFLVGARLGMIAIARGAGDKIRTLAYVTAFQACLIAITIAIAIAFPIVEGAPARYVVAIVLAVAMGAQNAVVKHLAVADLTTSVLTMTLTALGAGTPGRTRRYVSVVAMFGGALAGGLIVLHAGLAYALAFACVLTLSIATGALIASRTH